MIETLADLSPPPTSDEAWEVFRQRFFPQESLNLSPQTFGVPSSWVVHTIRRWEDAHNHVPSRCNQEGIAELHRVKALAATVWPAPEMELALSTGTTQSINQLVLALADSGTQIRILTTPFEHIGGIQAFERHPGFQVFYLSSREVLSIEAFAEAVDRIRPDVSVFSHVTYASGRILPVSLWAGLLRSIVPDSLVVIDAAQSLARLPLPFESADLVVASGHKWLNGPRGTGFVWLSEHARSRLGAFSWGGARLPQPGGVEDFEPAGGQDFAKLTGLTASLQLHAHIGEARVNSRSRRLEELLLSKMASSSGFQGGLTVNPPECSGGDNLPRLPGVITLASPQSFAPLVRVLASRRMDTKLLPENDSTAGARCRLRLGLPYYESASRISRLSHALEKGLTLCLAT